MQGTCQPANVGQWEWFSLLLAIAPYPVEGVFVAFIKACDKTRVKRGIERRYKISRSRLWAPKQLA